MWSLPERPLLAPGGRAAGPTVGGAGEGRHPLEDRLGPDVGAVRLTQLICSRNKQNINSLLPFGTEV